MDGAVAGEMAQKSLQLKACSWIEQNDASREMLLDHLA
jgi:hypothetical protein